MDFKKVDELINQRKFKEAKAILIDLIQKNKRLNDKLEYNEKNFKNIYFILSQICNQLNELKDSIKYLEEHIKINPNDCEGLLSLANLQLKTRQTENIEKNYKKILNINKNYTPALINLAFFYEGIGKISDAKKCYERAYKLHPENLNYFYNIIRIDPSYINDERINYIKKNINKDKLLKKDEYLKDFIFSKNCEKKKDYENEIKFLELSHKNFLKYNINKKSYEYWLKIIPKFFNKLLLKNSKKKKLENMRPIFIIGLPRSGSTITEMILSTSTTPKHNLGETSLINQILIRNYSHKFFDNFELNNIEIDTNLFEDKIISNLENFDISVLENKIIIDKSLENFFYFDLLVKIFPKAKFILTERNMKENILGIYKKILLNISWAHSLPDILNYIENYKKITDFFKKKYNKKIYSIKLEDIQNLDEKKIKNLFQFCDLKFNKKYFDFQKNYQFVNNASNIQIRSKLKKNNKNKYKKYFKLLDQFKNEYSWLK